MFKLRITALLAAALLISGCGSPPLLGPLQGVEGPTSSVRVLEGQSLPLPDLATKQATTRPYLIGPGDVVEISVFDVDGLEAREYRIDSSGRFSFPLIGSIDAQGLRPTELEQEIYDRLNRDFIREPRVTVNLKEAIGQNVTVSGEVERPGIYPVANGLTLISAVAVAGGSTDFARTEEVIIMRTVNGQRVMGLYNLGGIQRGNYDDPEIFADDIVIVGDSPQRRLIRDLVTAAPSLLAPILVTLTN